MTIDQLIANYSFAADVVTVILCTTLFFLIRFSLYFLTDQKFKYLKRSVAYITIAAATNIIFATVCIDMPDYTHLLIGLRMIYHLSLMCCMYTFILYMKHLLKANGRIVTIVTNLTRVIFCIAFIVELTCPWNKQDFYIEGGLFYDPVVNPYTVIYVYGLLVLLVMLLKYKDRLILPVRNSLIMSELIIFAVMLKSTLVNTTTYTAFTYLLPLIVVLILLHSKPFDDVTGAMSGKSFESYLERACKKGISMDFLVLQLNMNLENDVPLELGKLLSTFWHSYFKEAMFFAIDKEEYVLVVPRTKKNGNTEESINTLFYDIFPKYYAQYQFQYKIIAMTDIDFVDSTDSVKGIVTYLSATMEDNTALIIDDDIRHRLRIMRDVREHLMDIDKKGDINDARVLAYCQPILNMTTGRYDTAESLMRLDIPGHGIITPNLFIPLAEHYGHIHALTRVMLNKVCKQINELEKAGYSFNRISVNFAVSEIRNEDFCSEILSILESHSVAPSKIGIELTESQNEADFKIVRDKIAFLKDKGMTIYLDDFGTGYSNLDRILKLGLDVIKYDRSILLAAEDDDNASYMVQHFAEAFKKFNYSLLFEGVETEEQERLCLGCGANYLQGFKFSRPIPIEKLNEYFEK